MRNRPDTGSATAETAVALPALVLVVAVCVWALAVVATGLRCAEAARAGARAAARGDTATAVSDAARRAAGHPVEVAVSTGSELVTVEVTAIFEPPTGLLRALLPATTVRRAATAAAEPAGSGP